VELRIDEQSFLIQDPLGFFDQAVNNPSAHDEFFSTFTIFWRVFLHQNRFISAEKVWDFTLRVAFEWESKNKGKRIHKGTPYYFWGVTCILNGDLEKGFLLMHQALEEDKRTHKTKIPGTPAYYFVTLNYEKQNQFFRPKVEEIALFVNEKLNNYSSSRGGTLTLSAFKSKFLEDSELQEEVFYFVFEAFQLKKILTEIDKKLKENVFSSLLQANIIFDFCLIVDNVLKQKNPNQWKFTDHLKFLSSKSSLNLNDQKIGELNNSFQNDFSNVLQNLLSSLYYFQDGTTPQPIEEDFSITYGFRNFGAHKIENQPVIHQNFDAIAERILNALFFTIEKLYL